MLRYDAGKQNQAGFSLPEVLIVVAIGLVFCAALPLILASALILLGNREEAMLLRSIGLLEHGAELTGWIQLFAKAIRFLLAAIANMKLRTSMTTVSGLLQNTRGLAVNQNKTMTARHFNRSAIPYSLVYYVKQASDASSMAGTDTQVEMEAPITPYTSPTGTGAPAVISNTVLGLSADPQTSDPSFNSRGLPCVYSGGVCTNDAFIQYFKDNRIGGATGGWAAISITPAGRIKRWFWNGSAWTD